MYEKKSAYNSKSNTKQFWKTLIFAWSLNQSMAAIDLLIINKSDGSMTNCDEEKAIKILNEFFTSVVT